MPRRRALPVEIIGDRLVDDGQQRLTILAERQGCGKIRQAQHEVLGAVERIDAPEERRRRVPQAHALLFTLQRMIGKGRPHAGENGLLGCQIRLRLQRPVGFLVRARGPGTIRRTQDRSCGLR
ncbi:MAG TPA: hypothetical protein VFV38_50620, partial [Ktedonobacteraceae bacterium]|nr:hypothetical protein [Ktedonobacteraceae bacterium]